MMSYYIILKELKSVNKWFSPLLCQAPYCQQLDPHNVVRAFWLKHWVGEGDFGVFQHSSLWEKSYVVPISDGVDLKTSYGHGNFICLLEYRYGGTNITRSRLW